MDKMPTITFSLKDLQRLVGKKLEIEEVTELAHYGKGDVDSYDRETDEVKIDFGDTNLPYLWSSEGFARLIKGILGMQKGVPEIKLQKNDYQVIVDKSVAKIRPFIACFAAKGRKIDDYLLKQLVQLQEKFCETYGRRRQKVSIGLYSYKRLAFPVHYKAVSHSIEFVPLEFKAKMSLKDILAEHPKGKEYAWILEGFDKYPVLIDDKNEMMSFIPIINSNFTGKLEIGDENLFFEATGTDAEAVNLAANIFAYALSDRGFDIYSAEIKYPDRKAVAPCLKSESIHIKNEQIKSLFGLELKENEARHLLERAQYNFSDYKIGIPPYRQDIMHPFDVIEDVGIMYGYDNVKELPLTTYTTGSALKSKEFIDKVREIIVGLGYQEIMSAILTNKDFLYKKMSIGDFGRIAIASSHENSNYTEMRQVLDYIMKCFGLKCDIEEAEHGSFIEGRCARAIVHGKKIAYLGEINPQVLENWNLDMPVAAMELNLSEMFEVVEKK